MNKYRVILFLVLSLMLLLVTSQVFASSGNSNPQASQNTPGAKATEKAIERATEQAGNPNGKHENFSGIVSAIDSTSVTLTLRDGSSVTVGMNADTRLK